MKSLLFTYWASTTTIPNLSSITQNPTPHFPFSSVPILNVKRSIRLPTITRSQFSSNSRSNEEETFPESQVEELSIPDHWLHPSKALEVMVYRHVLKSVQESEWLRVTLHKWLDDEYCPEPTNVEISNVAARSYYESLLEKQKDLGEILLKMARELESISYQESFHGAFSSANAAMNLIALRIEQA